MRRAGGTSFLLRVSQALEQVADDYDFILMDSDGGARAAAASRAAQQLSIRNGAAGLPANRRLWSRRLGFLLARSDDRRGGGRSMLGVSPSAYEEACGILGPENAATIVACILERGGHINSAGGYLRDLTRRAERGEFSIGPMLMALTRANGTSARRAG